MSDLGTIVNKCRIRLQSTSPSGILKFPSSELKLSIGESYSKYTLQLIENDCGFFKTTAYLPFEAYNQIVDLSGLDLLFYKTEILYRIFPDGTQKPITRKIGRFESDWASFLAGSYFMFSGYFEKGNNIQLIPRPNFSEAAWAGDSAYPTSGLRLDYYYLPEFPTFDSDDSFEFDSNFPAILENLIVVDTCINVGMLNKGLTGGELGMQTWYNEREKWEEKLENYFNKNEAPMVITPYGQNFNTPY